MAFYSIPNIFYIMRKTHDQKKRRELLIEICNVLTVVSASHEKVVDAINREDFLDFEDCLQLQCAKEIQADYIITRNANDYRYSDVEAITLEQFMEIMEKE